MNIEVKIVRNGIKVGKLKLLKKDAGLKPK
jgi:hypothetical protein